MTTHSDPTDHPRRWNEAVWEQGNLDVVDELVAERFVGHDPALPEPMCGPRGTRRVVELIRSAFSDVTVTLEDVVAEGERIAVHNTFSGVHTGEYMGIEPTGEPFEIAVMAFQRIEDGKLVEERQLVDRFTLLQQLGVLDEHSG